MKFSDLSIGKKLRVNIIITLFFFILFSGSGLFGFYSVKKQFSIVTEDSVPDITAILQLNALSKRLFAEIQGFVVTGDKEEVEEFYDASERFDHWLSRWHIDPDDKTEISLKRLMSTHRDTFVQYGQEIFGAKLTMDDQLTQLSFLIEELKEKIEFMENSWEIQENLLLFKTSLYEFLLLSEFEDEEMGAEEDENMEEILNRCKALYISFQIHPAAKDDALLAGRLNTMEELATEIVQHSTNINKLIEKVEDYEDEILRTVTDLIALQNTEVETAFNQTTSTLLSFSIFLSIFTIFIIILLIIVSRITEKSIVNPVTLLSDAIRDVARGNLAKRVHQYNNDELGLLTKGFNAMTEKLEETTVSRKYLNDIVTNLNVSMVVLSPDGIIQLANQSLLDLLGYTHEEIIDQNFFSLIYQNHDSDNPIKQILNQPIKGLSANYRTKENSSIPILFSGAAIKDDEGEILNIVCIASDIREMVQVQRELKESYEELQNTQNQLIQSSKLASIGELAAGIAHELNQPLMIIRTGTQLLDRKNKKGSLDEESLRKHIDSILANSKRMNKIIDHLRKFSRQSGNEHVEVDVNQVIQDCFFMIGEQLKLSEICVTTDYGTELSKIKGDANQLEQVILNLLSNGRDAIHEKNEGAETKTPGTISIVTSQPVPDTIEIRVKDNGTGIPEQIMDKIFDPFYTSKEEGKGTGLGLSISYGILKDHNATLEIIETSENGTEMCIRIPVSK